MRWPWSRPPESPLKEELYALLDDAREQNSVLGHKLAEINSFIRQQESDDDARGC